MILPRTHAHFRLFQIMAGARYGGAELFFERLARGFHHAGIQQSIVIKNHRERYERLVHDLGGDDWGGYDLDVHTLSFAPALRVVHKYKLRHLIERAEADIVLSWMNRATLHTPKTNRPHVARLGGYYDLKYYQKCDWLVANTKGIADYLLTSGWPAAKLHHQVNFVPDGTEAQAITLPQNAHGQFIISAVGRLHHNKGFDILLRALRHIPDAYLVLAGEGPQAVQLQQLAAALGLEERVWFLGWHDQPQSIMKASDVFVCPSRHEPFGNVIAEAFATKTAVIATASEGAREYITDQQDGLIVPVDDVRALAESIKMLMRDAGVRTSLAQKGYESWHRLFRPEIVVHGWINFLNEVK